MHLSQAQVEISRRRRAQDRHANFDVRRRLNSGWNSSQLKNFNANINFNASSASPYTIRTGVDTNGDLLFTDRPDGVGRNTARGAGQWNLNGFFTYSRQFGKPVQMSGGINFRSDGGALTASQGAASSAGRFRVSFNVHPEHHQPRESRRVHRHADLPGLRRAVRHPRHPEG
jgi:hypothetical protein